VEIDVCELSLSRNFSDDFRESDEFEMKREGNDAEPRLLSIKGAAEFLGVSHWSVRAMIWDGSLPFVRVAKAHMVEREDLLKWIREHKEQNSSGTKTGTRRFGVVNGFVSSN